MPKKPARNSFYFFMVAFREEAKKKGIIYNNMMEVQQAAGPEWASAPSDVRAKYEAMAKAEKQKRNIPEMKFTSNGVSLAEIEARERAAKEAVAAEKRDIINFVKQKSANKTLVTEHIYLMDVNSYCKTRDTYLIGEVTLLRFSLKGGIVDNYHELINPGCIPVGFGYDVKLGSKELGLPMPDEDAPRCDYFQVLANMVDYLRRSTPHPEPLPPVYTMPEKVAECTDFIEQLCVRCADDEHIFRVYRLDWLFFHITEEVSPTRADAFPKESLALAQLKRDLFKYNTGLACDTHEEADKVLECTSARVKRWAFTVLDTTCARLKITPKPEHHVPASFDIEKIENFMDEHREFAPADNTNSTMDGGESNVSANTSAVTASTQKKRVHVPLRKPFVNYASGSRTVPDMETEQLNIVGGRGRGLISGSLEKMKI